MATTKRQALYTITLVEVAYDVDERVAVPAGEQMVNGYHFQARRGQTVQPMRIRIGRRETRTALLVDVPAELRFEAQALVEASVREQNERDGGTERYIVCERQRGRVIRETAA